MFFYSIITTKDGGCMERNKIDIYIYTILKKQLQKLKISNYGLYSIMDNVKKQLNSIIKHWNDEEFINAIFSTVVEEGHFYKPYVNDKIGNLVVLGIRNSLLEIAASVNYKEFGLKKDLSVDDIKLITSSAIDYFKNIDIESLSLKIKIDDDYYYNITKKYDIAYKSLVELGKCTPNKLEIEFEKKTIEPYILEELFSNTQDIDIKDTSYGKKVTDVTNGISNELPKGLINLLEGILKKEATMIYVDSFKYLSRNFEINLKILQFLLTHDAMFLTNNFLIKNGYVSRRKNLIRASHGDNFNEEAIMTIGEVSSKYKQYLEKMM